HRETSVLIGFDSGRILKIGIGAWIVSRDPRSLDRPALEIDHAPGHDGAGREPQAAEARGLSGVTDLDLRNGEWSEASRQDAKLVFPRFQRFEPELARGIRKASPVTSQAIVRAFELVLM